MSPYFKNRLIQIIENTPAEKLPRTESVAFALKLLGTSISKISKEYNFSPKNAYAVLRGDKVSWRIKEVIIRALGADPWA